MKAIFVSIALVLTLSSCKKDFYTIQTITGAGNVVTETRSLPSFSKVIVEGSGTASIVYSTEQNVAVSGYENLLPIFESVVVNGTLILKYKNNYDIRNSNVSATISVPRLEAVTINGSGTVTMQNFSGTVLKALIVGSGEITGEGCVFERALLQIDGSGKIAASSLQTMSAEARVEGSGTINVWCKQNLVAKIFGSGAIYYWGNPTSVASQISGSGQLIRR